MPKKDWRPFCVPKRQSRIFQICILRLGETYLRCKRVEDAESRIPESAGN